MAQQPGAAFEQYTAEWEWSHEVRELHEAYRAACDAWDTLERISRKVARDNHEDYTNEQRLRINELELQAWRLRQGLESIGREAVAAWEAEQQGKDAGDEQTFPYPAVDGEKGDEDDGRDWEGEALATREAELDARQEAVDRELGRFPY